MYRADAAGARVVQVTEDGDAYRTFIHKVAGYVCQASEVQ